MKMILEKLSATRLNTFLTCQMRFYIRYVMGERIIPSAAMMLGGTFHNTVGFNLEQKIESHEDLPVDDVLEYFAADYEIRQKEALWMPSEDPGKVKDTGISIVREYQSVAAPTIQPVSVEHNFIIETAEYDFPFEGFIDCVDDKSVIIETKTTRSRVPAPKFDHQLQAFFYALGFRFEGASETAVQWDYVVKTKTPSIQRFSHVVNYDDLVFLSRTIEKMVNLVDREIFMPNRAHFTCSRRWCGFWQQCEEECGGTVRD